MRDGPSKKYSLKYASTLDMKNSKEKYVICTQKDLYKADLRRIPGVPLIYFNRSVLTLDTPSKNSHHAADSAVMSKLGITKDEKKEIGIRKEKREERSYVHVVCVECEIESIGGYSPSQEKSQSTFCEKEEECASSTSRGRRKEEGAT